MERIQKLIAQAGIASRRKAEELIEQGRVKVNGKTASLGMKADGRSIIEVDGRKITNQQKEYYLLNKPKHCICSLHDEKGRDTVMKYMTGVNARVYPVGRLDYDTTGVLILSNDGEFSNLMMHPSHHISKTYEAAIQGILTSSEIRQLQRGIPLDDGMTLPAKVSVISVNDAKQKSVIQITIQEGRNREVRRMMEYFHCNVIRLERKKLGFLDVGTLRQGEYRKLKAAEVQKLTMLAQKGKAGD